MKPTQARFQIATVVALAAVFLAASSVSAAITQWDVRPDLSFLSANGTTVVGIPLTPQAPGSDQVALDGTIEGDLVGGSLDLTGMLSSVDALGLPVNTYLPVAVNRTTDDIGQNAPAIFFNSAIGDLLLSFSSGTLVNGNPVNGTGVQLEYVAGWLEFQTPIFAGGVTQSGSLAGDNDPNTSPGLFTISQVGLIETITIPIFVQSDQGGGTVLVTSGQIVAERTIPEPSTLVLAGLGAIGLAYVARRRK